MTSTPSAGESGRRPAGDGTGLARALSELALNLEDEGDLDSTLAAIARTAVTTVPGAGHASLSMVRGRQDVQTRAATSDLSRDSDRAQYETKEGPCLDALYQAKTVHLPDMTVEQRWPSFARRATALGVRSMMSVQLFVRGDDLGALNLLSEDSHAFGEDSEGVALLFATHAAVAIVGAEKEDQLRDVLSSRDIVGQAMGIVMERYDLTAPRAFSVLVRLSEHSNRRLFDLAQGIVRSRDIPEVWTSS